MNYTDFLRRKIAMAASAGFDVDDAEINPALKPHQRACVQWAVRGGRRALFESFGLGKTVQQLEIIRLVLAKLGSGRGLIVCPLGVRQEFKRDAIERLGWSGAPRFVRWSSEVEGDGIYLTNYESVRDGRLDPHLFVYTDITRMLTLNSTQSQKGKQMHLCPMQFDLADRAISQWTMPGETVLDPFGGLMTVPYRAVLNRRHGIGIELSHGYFLDGASYCEAAARAMSMPTLFDTIEQTQENAA